ncbi:hypothetical protein [Ralstonia sp. UBA689]|uniref:hypothetical protein n=1 Tax=Ralstonia sp. UBA689 TaxID=1947373 RepID=UPI0025F73B65|nr:hypothetical protein [Ralstonia sp. UBA689]
MIVEPDPALLRRKAQPLGKIVDGRNTNLAGAWMFRVSIGTRLCRWVGLEFSRMPFRHGFLDRGRMGCCRTCAQLAIARNGSTVIVGRCANAI